VTTSPFVWEPEPVMRVGCRAARTRHRAGSPALTIALVSHGQWFFVNLYEAIVRMPGRLADWHDSSDRRPGRGPVAPGSPARYHLAAAPLVLGSCIAALVNGLRKGGDRPALVVAAASSLTAVTLTGYLVRTVNLRLFDDGLPIDAAKRRRLVNRWHGVNRVRLALLAVASVALERAGRRECDRYRPRPREAHRAHLQAAVHRAERVHRDRGMWHGRPRIRGLMSTRSGTPGSPTEIGKRATARRPAAAQASDGHGKHDDVADVRPRHPPQLPHFVAEAVKHAPNTAPGNDPAPVFRRSGRARTSPRRHRAGCPHSFVPGPLPLTSS
jgi:hypothetical protein